MGILDDAIREHLELKRQHGAAGDDLRKAEQEAFGPADEDDDDGVAVQTDEAAEAPTQFLSTEGVAEAPAPDLATSPEPPAQEPETIAAEPAPEPEPEQDAAEHEIPEPPAAAEAPAPGPPPSQDAPQGPNTEERHAIAEHPTELYDVAAELSGEEEGGEGAVEDNAASEDPAAAEAAPTGLPDDGADMGAEAELAIGDDEDFFNEQTLSDELDQALDSPELGDPSRQVDPELEPPVDEHPGQPDTEAPVLEPDPDPVPEPPAREPVDAEPQPEPTAEHALPEPESYQPLSVEEGEDEDELPPPPPEPGVEPEPEPAAEPAEPGSEGAAEGEGGFYDQDEDVLEETPEFLQDTPEHDRLWFEQKPPKDFDFDD